MTAHPESDLQSLSGLVCRGQEVMPQDVASDNAHYQNHLSDRGGRPGRWSTESFSQLPEGGPSRAVKVTLTLTAHEEREHGKQRRYST